MEPKLENSSYTLAPFLLALTWPVHISLASPARLLVEKSVSFCLRLLALRWEGLHKRLGPAKAGQWGYCLLWTELCVTAGSAAGVWCCIFLRRVNLVTLPGCSRGF